MKFREILEAVSREDIESFKKIEQSNNVVLQQLQKNIASVSQNNRVINDFINKEHAESQFEEKKKEQERLAAEKAKRSSPVQTVKL